MSFFPAYLNITDKKILVIGGGNIAAEKLGRLVEFTKNIVIISPKINEDTKNIVEIHQLLWIQKYYESGDVDFYDIIISAIDDIPKQTEIYAECKSKRILCNSVDKIEMCDFIFPSFIKKGDLTISFSTGGVSPSLAKYLRMAIETLIPKNIEEFLGEIKILRNTIPKGKERMKMLDQKAKEYIKKEMNANV